MTAEIKKILGTDKLVIGTDRVVKLLNTGSVEKIFVASNTPEDVKQDIQKYSEISSTKVELLEIPNEELGILCKKTFPVSVLGKKR